MTPDKTHDEMLALIEHQRLAADAAFFEGFLFGAACVITATVFGLLLF